jgi:hypothetical protein
LKHPTPGTSKESVTQPDYLVAKFKYNAENDSYTCPQGETLKTTGRWHKKSGRTEQSGYQFKKYRTLACKQSLTTPLYRKTSRKRNRSEQLPARR